MHRGLINTLYTSIKALTDSTLSLLIISFFVVVDPFLKLKLINTITDRKMDKTAIVLMGRKYVFPGLE
jgi:hypothetical protein